MSDVELRYGMNPHQAPARCEAVCGRMPFAALNGQPSLINVLDALNGWQLVRELREATQLAAAASFKHVNPAGVGLGLPLPSRLRSAYMLGRQELSAAASAYARARGTDRMASYGDFVAVSDAVDTSLATLLSKEVSNGIIAPDYEPDALEILQRKAKGRFLILRVDRSFAPPAQEARELFGVRLTQPRNDASFSAAGVRSLAPRGVDLPQALVLDILVTLVTLKYTQSNSICLTLDGQTIGVGAGQQSRHPVHAAGDRQGQGVAHATAPGGPLTGVRSQDVTGGSGQCHRGHHGRGSRGDREAMGRGAAGAGAASSGP